MSTVESRLGLAEMSGSLVWHRSVLRLAAYIAGAMLVAGCGLLRDPGPRYTSRSGAPYEELPKWVSEPYSYYPHRPEELFCAVGVAERRSSEAEQRHIADQHAIDALARSIKTTVESEVTDIMQYKGATTKTAEDRVEETGELKERFSSMSKHYTAEVLHRSRLEAVCRDRVSGRLYVLHRLVLPRISDPKKAQKAFDGLERSKASMVLAKAHLDWLEKERRMLLDVALVLKALMEGIRDYGPPEYPEDGRVGISFSDWNPREAYAHGSSLDQRRVRRFNHRLCREVLQSNTIAFVERGWRERLTRYLEFLATRHSPEEARIELGCLATQRYSIKAEVWCEKRDGGASRPPLVVELALWEVQSSERIEMACVELEPTANEDAEAKRIRRMFERAVVKREGEM